jgi:hypothetical protein
VVPAACATGNVVGVLRRTWEGRRCWLLRRAGALAVTMAMFTVVSCSGAKLTPPASPEPTPAPAPGPTGPVAPTPGPVDPADESAGDVSIAGYTPTGTIVADSTFRPDDHGFQFQNYGTQLADGSIPSNLTPDDLHAMFGDGVCAGAATATVAPAPCALIPEAQAWLDAANDAMTGGHCYGFSVAAELLWQRKLDITRFGAGIPNDLTIDDNQLLQRRIAYDWAMQLLSSVRSQVVSGTPNEILQTLTGAMRPDPPESYTIAIFKRDGTGGHAVTPFAIEDLGGGKSNVLIYDNNWPGVVRAISFDTAANTWRYTAGTNPKAPQELYEGDAKSESIALYPISPGLGPQRCPFCGKRRPPAGQSAPLRAGRPQGDDGADLTSETMEIYLESSHTRHADLLITDDGGRRVGMVHGRLVDEIPGARVEQPISNQDWRDDMEPRFIVPANTRYTITVDGSRLAATDTETVGVIGPGFDVAVRDIPMTPGEIDVLVVAPDASELSYHSSRTEHPTIEVGVSDAVADYAFELAGIADRAGSTVHLSLPIDGGTLKIRDAGNSGRSNVGFKMTRNSDQGVQIYRHDATPLSGDDSAELQFGNWTASDQTIPLVITHDGHRSTKTLTNGGTG